MQVDVYLPLHYPNATFSSFDTPKCSSGWIFWGMRWTDADFQSSQDKTARTWEPTWPKRNISFILTTLFETLTMFNMNTMYCHVNKGFPWTLRRAPFDSEGCGSRNNWSMAVTVLTSLWRNVSSHFLFQNNIASINYRSAGICSFTALLRSRHSILMRLSLKFDWVTVILMFSSHSVIDLLVSLGSLSCCITISAKFSSTDM